MNAQSTGAPGLPDFVPVIIIGAGPTGITAATLLAQYGIDCLVQDRHETAYPLPRAVHADDEIYRWPAWRRRRARRPPQVRLSRAARTGDV
jgi:3-(3-hydroxy-phenyl)propionate hydroxylase